MYPTGHARNTTADLKKILSYKGHTLLGDLVFDDRGVKTDFIQKLENMGSMTDISGLYSFEAPFRQHPPIDG